MWQFSHSFEFVVESKSGCILLNLISGSPAQWCSVYILHLSQQKTKMDYKCCKRMAIAVVCVAIADVAVAAILSTLRSTKKQTPSVRSGTKCIGFQLSHYFNYPHQLIHIFIVFKFEVKHFSIRSTMSGCPRSMRSSCIGTNSCLFIH